ncbi:response regulator transcription factor [bacterium]|nr:response regulator transcription factor [bacterium]
MSNIKVLLVEDHTMTRMGLSLVLEKAEGVELIAEAENGLKGVELAQSLIPNVILMDIGLPDIDGIEATRRIKDAKLPCKILIFTSRDNEDDVFACFKAGADGYIMKGAS